MSSVNEFNFLINQLAIVDTFELLTRSNANCSPHCDKKLVLSCNTYLGVVCLFLEI